MPNRLLPALLLAATCGCATTSPGFYQPLRELNPADFKPVGAVSIDREASELDVFGGELVHGTTEAREGLARALEQAFGASGPAHPGRFRVRASVQGFGGDLKALALVDLQVGDRRWHETGVGAATASEALIGEERGNLALGRAVADALHRIARRAELDAKETP
jgi:hypothetical protein